VASRTTSAYPDWRAIMRGKIHRHCSQRTRSEINGRQTSECRPACRLDRRDPVIVDEEVDKRRVVAIERPT
jgi:hypothetical protein